MKADGLLVSELEGEALDWAVAKAIGDEDVRLHDGIVEDRDGRPVEHFVIIDCEDYSEKPFRWVEAYSPSTDWSQCGPLIEACSIAISSPGHSLLAEKDDLWCASTPSGAVVQTGKTPLIAACRAIVAAKLGDRAEVSIALLKATAPTNPGA